MKRVLMAMCFLAILPTTTLGAELNAGIVQGLWYSTDTVFADTPVRIYVAIRNSTGGDLTGTVTFYDNEHRIGSQSVSALSGRIIESWIDWHPSYGEHTLVAKLTRVQVSTADASTINGDATVTAAEDSIFVDYDTDADGVGNERDIDDDGDGISDAVETTNGTDPLTYDVPPPTVTEADSGEHDQADPNTSTTTSTGLERYLTPSRADSILTNITTWTLDTKQSLDTYRDKRAAARNGTADVAIEVNEDGFGAVTRSTDTETKRATAEIPDGFLGDVIHVIGAIIGSVVTAILATVSWTLGYPMLVQLFLLCAILASTVLIARKLGGRPIRD